MAGMLVMQLGHNRFTWGSTSLAATGNVRMNYIDALRAADQGRFAPLINFSRT